MTDIIIITIIQGELCLIMTFNLHLFVYMWIIIRKINLRKLFIFMLELIIYNWCHITNNLVSMINHVLLRSVLICEYF